MSRALTSSEYCSIALPASPGLTEGLLVGIYGIAIAANQTNSCSDSTSGANGFGSSSSMTVLSSGTGAATGATYTFGVSGRGALPESAVLRCAGRPYFGLTHDGNYNCASDVRRSLIRNWKNLFMTDCAAGDTTCAAGLTHAWRRSDLAGTTDAFVSILNPPNGTATNGKGAAGSVGIGTLSAVPVGKTPKSNPFCNSVDATRPGADVLRWLVGLLRRRSGPHQLRPRQGRRLPALQVRNHLRRVRR